MLYFAKIDKKIVYDYIVSQQFCPMRMVSSIMQVLLEHPAVRHRLQVRACFERHRISLVSFTGFTCNSLFKIPPLPLYPAIIPWFKEITPYISYTAHFCTFFLHKSQRQRRLDHSKRPPARFSFGLPLCPHLLCVG